MNVTEVRVICLIYEITSHNDISKSEIYVGNPLPFRFT
jgi:hypothetical protein